MATNNQLNVGLSGASGTGSFAGTTSATLVTPVLGVATATSVAFSPNTGGLIGAPGAVNATSGIVGEYVSSEIGSGSAVSLTSTNTSDITNLVLTAGDWFVYGSVVVTGNSGTTIGYVMGWNNNASATAPAASNRTRLYLNQLISTISESSFPIPSRVYNLNSSTTVYLSVQASFATSTASAYGNLYARRVR